MKRIVTLSLILVLGSAGFANAQPPEVACFEWSCWASSYNPWVSQCTFDVTCSLPDAGFVAYRWDWGDGTVTLKETSQIVSHVYHQPLATPRLTILLFGAPGETIACDILTYQAPIGPPEPRTGICSSH